MCRHRSPSRWFTRVSGLSKSRWAHRIFWISIFFKMFDGVLECLGGVGLLVTSSQTVVNIVRRVVAPELAEDPTDWMANHLLYAAFHLSSNPKTFAIAYLLVHGITKLVIVTAIWFSQLWAYWLAGVIFALFVVYQMERFFVTHSSMMLFLTAVDLVIIALLPSEHRRLSLEIKGRPGARS